MRSLLTVLPGLACAAMMLVICLPMMRGHSKSGQDDDSTKKEVAELRGEIAKLRAEQEGTERKSEHV